MEIVRDSKRAKSDDPNKMPQYQQQSPHANQPLRLYIYDNNFEFNAQNGVSINFIKKIIQERLESIPPYFFYYLNLYLYNINTCLLHVN